MTKTDKFTKQVILTYFKHFKIIVMVFGIFQINVNTIQFNKRMRCVKVTFSSLAPLLQQKPNLVPQGF